MTRAIKRSAPAAGWPVIVVALLALAARGAFASPVVTTGGGTGHADTAALTPYLSSRTSVLPAGVRELVAHASVSTAVPSFARQTGLACSACHYQFPQLTPFGRLFQDQWVLVGRPQDDQRGRQAKGGRLGSVPIGPLSIMFQTSLNSLNKTLPGTQNNTVEFPQQLSLFFGAAISPHVGALVQMTYNGASGTIGMDNTDIRFANRGGDFIYGVTLNNNPTVQDVWQSTPAWGFPYASSEITPGSIGSPLINGGLAQQVLGAGAYVLWKNLVYMEINGYRSAPQGAATPADDSSSNTINGISPYWRIALQHQFGADYAEIGTYGIDSHLYPTGVSGSTNAYTDLAYDLQYEHSIYGTGALIAHVNWITETQSLNAFYGGATPMAANLHNSIDTFNANASFLPNGLFGLTLGYFSTTGTKDTLLYTPAPVTGSRVGTPNTSGVIEELDINPWENTRFTIQATQFAQFNGFSQGYDGYRSQCDRQQHAVLPGVVGVLTAHGQAEGRKSKVEHDNSGGDVAREAVSELRHRLSCI